MLTVLARMAPGSCIPLHTHTDIEQTFNATGLEKDVTGFLEIAIERGWISV